MINTEQTNGYKLYHGVTKFKVLGINPELIQLNNWGVKFDKETNYWDSDTLTRRVDIWVQDQTEDIITKVAFFLKPPKKSTSGKYQWIDVYGNTTWYEEGGTNNNQYFDFNSARKAYENEEYLTGFMKSFVSPKKGVEFRFDSIESMYNDGDFNEIKTIFKSLPDNEVVGALGIVKNKYYTIYPKYFLASWMTDLSKLSKKLDEDTYKKADYGISPYTFCEYSSEPKASEVKVNDDLPF